MAKNDEKEIVQDKEIESPSAPPAKKTYKTKNNTIAERLATHIKIEDLSKIKFTTKQAKILLGEEDKKPPSRFKTEEAKQLSIKRMREGLKKYHSDLKLAKEEIARETKEQPKLVLQVHSRKNANSTYGKKRVSIKPSKSKGDVSDNDDEPVSDDDDDRRQVKPSSDDDTDHIIHKVNKKVSKKNSKLAEINAKIAAQQEAQKPVNPYSAQLKNLWG